MLTPRQKKKRVKRNAAKSGYCIKGKSSRSGGKRKDSYKPKKLKGGFRR